MREGRGAGKELLKRKICKFNELPFFCREMLQLLHCTGIIGERLGIDSAPAVGVADLGLLSLSLDGIRGCQIGSGVTHLEHVWGLLWGKDVSYTPAPSSPLPPHGSNTISPPHLKPNYSLWLLSGQHCVNTSKNKDQVSRMTLINISIVPKTACHCKSKKRQINK